MLKKKVAAVSVSIQKPGKIASSGPNNVTNVRSNGEVCVISENCTCGNASLVDALKQRIEILEVENRRLMSNQGHLVAETNRRVEMHMDEMKGLKDELKRLQSSNKELRDLCCFLDDDRLKTRRLSLEWQKFGRYTSEVMKQEVQAYQAKLRELENRQQMLFNENDELRKLCLYLDEQRQTFLINKISRGSRMNRSEQSLLSKNGSNSLVCDSSGCGSSTGSQKGSEDEDDSYCDPQKLMAGYDDKQENTLRMISQQMQTSFTIDRHSDAAEKKSVWRNDGHDNIFLEYVQSLEARIRQLELTAQQDSNLIWCSSNKRNNDETPEIEDQCTPESTDINVLSTSNNSQQEPSCRLKSLLTSKKETVVPTTSMVSPSDTAYSTSLTTETTVFVTGDEFDPGVAQLEVRTLDPINEETGEYNGTNHVADKEFENEKLLSKCVQDVKVQMPPTIAPVSASVSRLSSCCSDLSFDGLPIHSSQPFNSYLIKPSERCSSLVNLAKCHDSLIRESEGSYLAGDIISDTGSSLQTESAIASKNICNLLTEETSLVHRVCKLSCNAFDRKAFSSINDCSSSTESLKTQMTAV